MFRFTPIGLLLVTGVVIVIGADASGAPKKKATKKKSTPNKGEIQQPKFGVPATSLPAPGSTARTAGYGSSPPASGLTTSYGSPSLAAGLLIEREVDVSLADDAKVQRLKSFANGLSYVSAGIEDVKEGQQVTLSLFDKIDVDKKKVQNLTGTVQKVSEDGQRLAIRFFVSEGGNAPDPDSMECALVSIRSLPATK
jgi:hypothetical protein